MEIQDARDKGFIRGAAIEVSGVFRIFKSGRIEKKGENLLAMGQSPFFIFYKGEWVARVINQNYQVEQLNSMK